MSIHHLPAPAFCTVLSSVTESKPSFFQYTQWQFDYIDHDIFTPISTGTKSTTKKLYDGIIIPEALIGVYPKAAIQKRKRWMVDQANLLIAYVYRDYGGAYETLKYAQRKGSIRIINLAEETL